MSLFQFKRKLPPGLTAEDVIEQEAWIASEAVAMKESCDHFMAELVDFPQYVSLYDALLHVPSGCLVTQQDSGIQLVYVGTGSSMTSSITGGQIVRLSNKEQLNKYMALMRLEAQKLESK
ncbi:hypothetical protein [Undibacterium sp.]|uniref:hypothetical protein n=1 Tax=Undibacterium sp. TaxID=1914977 RepID=UPI0037506003